MSYNGDPWFEHKRGATFDYTIEIDVDDAFDLAGQTASATLCDAETGEVIQQLECTIAGRTEIDVYVSAEACRQWPLVEAVADIKLVDVDGYVQSTQNFYVSITKNWS